MQSISCECLEPLIKMSLVRVNVVEVVDLRFRRREVGILDEEAANVLFADVDGYENINRYHLAAQRQLCVRLSHLLESLEAFRR